MLFICQSIDVGSQTGRRGRIDTGDMVVDTELRRESSAHMSTSRGKARDRNGGTYMLASISLWLLKKVNKIRRAKFS